jgi:tetratricopeptide (TPR) repeat protein
MHRLLSSLDDSIRRARIPREVPFLRAERALLYARLGECDSARREVVALRALPAVQSSPVLNAWLWLTEGLADYYENVGHRAHDRVNRALALAVSLKAVRVQALAAAWLAHMAFRAHDHAATAVHVATALRLAAADHHAARSRACLVTAGAYHYAGREDLAQPWYQQARSHAMQEGDGSALSSVMYNMAALRVMEVRLTERFGTADALKAKRAKLGTESSQMLDETVRTRALSHYQPMQRALILVAHHDYGAALELYDAHLALALAEGLSCTECLFEADRARCLLELGRGVEALAAARQADTAFMSATEPEEQAIAHAELADVFERLGLPDVALRGIALAQRQLTHYRAQCQQLLEALDAQQLDAVRTEPQRR